MLEQALWTYQQLLPDRTAGIEHESALTYMTLAYGVGREGDVEKAERLFAEATSRFEELVGYDPGNRSFRRELARCYVTARKRAACSPQSPRG